MKLRTNAWAATVLSATIIGAAVLGGATAAQAAPSDCVVLKPDNGVDVICHGGTGTYRGVVRCDRNNLPDYNRYGPWVTPGNWSSAWCNSSDSAFNQSMQTG